MTTPARTLAREENSLTLTQYIFDGWDRYNKLRSSVHQAISKKYQLEQERELLSLQAIDAYLECLRARAICETRFGTTLPFT